MSPPADQVYESCEAANDALGPCPRALVHSDGGHWWYIDNDEFEKHDGSQKFVPCVCKSCPQKMKLSVDAEEFPV